MHLHNNVPDIRGPDEWASTEVDGPFDFDFLQCYVCCADNIASNEFIGLLHVYFLWNLH